VSESTQASTTTSLDLVSRLDSSSRSNPGSFRFKPSSFPIGLRNAASTLQEINSILLQVSSRKLSRLPTRLNNVARAYQDLLQKVAGLVRRLRLTRAQEGLILTVTSQDCVVHWPGTFPQSSNTRLVEEAITLPYQEGGAFRNANALTKVISNSSRAGLVPAQEVFMIRQPPPMPPTAPDVRSSDELESNISPNAPKYDGKSKGQKRARERRNKPK
jgi:hypothetical protein